MAQTRVLVIVKVHFSMPEIGRFATDSGDWACFQLSKEIILIPDFQFLCIVDLKYTTQINP